MKSFENFNSHPEETPNVPEAEPIFQALNERKQKEEKDKTILSNFTPGEQTEIKYKQQILSSLAYFIGKDFKIPVELNQPGAGWHWDFEANKIRIDPKDLLEKDMDYLRFVISHEGGHRRISRTEFIPQEEWNEPGFSFMMNAIEDPRDNNFVAESYPKFKEWMNIAYQEDLDFEAKAKGDAIEKLGYQPRFMQAGFEYIKQWFKESKKESLELSEDLSPEVKAVVSKTLDSARDSWWRYPSRKEADKSEKLVSKYAEASYRINRDKIWPEFKKLVEEDMKDQKTQEALKDMVKGDNKGEGHGEQIPEPLKNNLTPKEQKELEKVLGESGNKSEKNKTEKEQKGQKGEEKSDDKKTDDSKSESSQSKEGNEKAEWESSSQPVGLDSLSEGLKEKIKKYVDSLPEEKKKELEERAKEELKKFEEQLNEDLGGKLTQNPGQKEKEGKKIERSDEEMCDRKTPQGRKPESDELKKFKERLKKELKGDDNVYEAMRREVLPIIDSLENDLRGIFVARRASNWEGGFKSGKRIDIKRRMQEKAKEVPVVSSRAWEKRELPQEKDYAISLLVDLSGSMQGGKITETFKSVVVLAEVLNRLSIKTEILGFNDRLYEYEDFNEPFSKEIREKMGDMLEEVDGDGAQWNDDGWALEEASKRLAKQKVDQKFLVALSDGLPEESPSHSGSKYDLHAVIERITKDTDQKLVGLGVGNGTNHVADYYPNSIANVKTEEMAEKLADLLREVIDNYAKF